MQTTRSLLESSPGSPELESPELEPSSVSSTRWSSRAKIHPAARGWAAGGESGEC